MIIDGQSQAYTSAGSFIESGAHRAVGGSGTQTLTAEPAVVALYPPAAAMAPGAANLGASTASIIVSAPPASVPVLQVIQINGGAYVVVSAPTADTEPESPSVPVPPSLPQVPRFGGRGIPIFEPDEEPQAPDLTIDADISLPPHTVDGRVTITAELSARASAKASGATVTGRVTQYSEWHAAGRVSSRPATLRAAGRILPTGEDDWLLLDLE